VFVFVFIFKVSALIVKENTDEFLMIKRGKEPNKGFWSLPGTHFCYLND
jgi:ADP-ribose pyrophosphatase YjhB (NUDIX family)